MADTSAQYRDPITTPTQRDSQFLNDVITTRFKYSDLIKFRSTVLFHAKPVKSMRSAGVTFSDSTVVDTILESSGSTWGLNAKKLGTDELDYEIIAFYNKPGVIFLLEKTKSKGLFEYLSDAPIADQEKEIESILNGESSWIGSVV